MTVWIVLLRGINVGGKHIVPMKRLRELLEESGFSGAQTYIQSGNCVFGSDETDAGNVAQAVAGAIEGEFGFRPSVFALTLEHLEAAIDANPFPANAGKTLHLIFLDSTPADADLDELRAIAPDNEAAEIRGNILYVYTPDGFGRSVIAQKLDRFIKVDKTARNLNTVHKLAEMARAVN
ncbi:DUF1697 domain-containing protein [Oricola indica]|uniref:DUF1697 domain-containing protein n=1 Tax=Oricola indica TaxID=2872591 RepID=UPI003CCBC5EB